MNSLLQMSHPAATQPAQEAAYPVLSTAVPRLNISLVPLTFSTRTAIRAIFALEASNQPVKNVPSAGIQKAEIRTECSGLGPGGTLTTAIRHRIKVTSPTIVTTSQT
jgi:hypothetical protein